jgi:hypothetical protein
VDDDNLTRFWADFWIGITFFPALTAGAVAISYILIITIFGPDLWLLLFYAVIFAFLFRSWATGRRGYMAAAALCFLSWAAFAQYQVVAAWLEARETTEANSQIKPRPGSQSVAFRTRNVDVVCDAMCTELLADGHVTTLFIDTGRQTHTLTLSREGPCQGPSMLASKKLRDNNRFDLCINDAVEPGSPARGLLIEQKSTSEAHFGRTREVRRFPVSEWVGDRWEPVYERRYEDVHVLQYFPAFAGYFTGMGSSGVAWWRREIVFGDKVDFKDVVSEALGIKLLGSYDTTVITRNGWAVTSQPNVFRPAPPAELAADIDRMSQDSDPAVLRIAAVSIGRFVKENKSYEAVRVPLVRLLASAGPEIKSAVYLAICCEGPAIDEQILASIMDGGPDWESRSLGALLGRLSEDELGPYEARIVDAFFDMDRRNRPNGRQALAAVLPALPLAAIERVFDRCADLSDPAIGSIGEYLDFNGRRISAANLRKLRTTAVPCLLRRMAALRPFMLMSVSRGLTALGEGSAAAAEVERRVAAPSPADSGNDLSNLKDQLAWIRNAIAARQGSQPSSSLPNQ